MLSQNFENSIRTEGIKIKNIIVFFEETKKGIYSLFKRNVKEIKQKQIKSVEEFKAIEIENFAGFQIVIKDAENKEEAEDICKKILEKILPKIWTSDLIIGIFINNIENKEYELQILFDISRIRDFIFNQGAEYYKKFETYQNIKFETYQNGKKVCMMF